MGYFLSESILTIVLAALVGAVIGFIVAWLLRSARADAARRSAPGDAATLKASLEECRMERSDLDGQVLRLREELEGVRRDLATSNDERDEARAAYEKSQVELATRTAELIGRDDELVRLRELVGAAPPVPPAPADVNTPATVIDLTEDGDLATEPAQPATGEPASATSDDATDDAPDGAADPDRAGDGTGTATPATLVGTLVADAPDDDLERIEGIGPKMRGALNRAGLRTFAAVAEASVDQLRGAVEADGLKFAPSIGTWARQARLLADGDEAGFNALKERLVAGRDVG